MKTTTFFQIYLDGNIAVWLKAILRASRVEFFKGLVKACLDIFQDICYARKLLKIYCFACFLKNEGFLKIISNHKKKSTETDHGYKIIPFDILEGFGSEILNS